MGRPKVHGDRTALALLDAAEDLLAAGGPDAVSVRAVAGAVGVSTRAVYSLFGGKEGLIQSLCERGFVLLEGLVAAVPATDDATGDLVEVGIAGFRRFATSRPQLFRLTFERSTPDVISAPGVSKAAIHSYNTFTSWIRRVEIGSRSVHVVAFQLHALCQGLATSELQAQAAPVGANLWPMTPGVGEDDIWRDALHAYLDGLANGA